MTRFALLIGAMGLAGGPAFAGDAGKRDFPATLVVEEPQVETEFVPQVATLKNSENARQTDIGAELSVQLTQQFAVVVHPIFTSLRPGGNGFQNLETTLKYQFIADPVHEFILSAGVSNQWSSIGARRVDADPYSTLQPTLFFGKGAGDLPEQFSWLKPFAVTGQLGLAVPAPTKSAYSEQGMAAEDVPALLRNPYTLSVQGSFQYNLVYAARYVPSLNIPKALDSLVPLVEYSVEIPVANNGTHAKTLGTINPGFLWCHGDVQIGVEALVPINHYSGTHPGVRVQLAYSFDSPFFKHESEKDGADPD